MLIHLRSVGEAPALIKSRFRISGEKKVIDVEKFVRGKLIPANVGSVAEIPSEQRQQSVVTARSVYLYCGTGFSPTADQILQVLASWRFVLPISNLHGLNAQDLFDCFQVGGELTIYYSFMEAWG